MIIENALEIGGVRTGAAKKKDNRRKPICLHGNISGVDSLFSVSSSPVSCCSSVYVLTDVTRDEMFSLYKTISSSCVSRLHREL